MRYHEICNRIASFLAIVTGVLLTGVLGVSIINILLRNVFSVSWLVTDVLLKMMFVWMVFIGASVAYYHHDHLKMDFLSNLLPKRVSRITSFVFIVVSIILLLVMVIYGWNISMVRMTIPFETNKAIPTGYLYLSVPICALIMIVFSIDHLMVLFRKEEESGETVSKSINN